MKRVFLSDVHMGAGRGFKRGYTGHVYDWLDEKEASAFADFLNYLNNSDADEIILLGDIMDNWVCPVDTPPPTFAEIIAAGINSKIIQNLRSLSANKKTIYVPGNHDMSVDEASLRTTFPSIVFQSEYRQDDIYAAHGSEYTMFCAPDPINDLTNRLPIGYYISRVAATNAAKTGSNNNLMTYIGRFIDKIVSEGIILAVFDTAASEAGLDEDTVIKQTSSENIIIRDVRTRYKDLYSQWNDDVMPRNAAVVEEANNLWSVVWTLSRRNDDRIIIFGHTHEKALNKLPLDEAGEDMYIYANTGTWCENDKGKDFTFIETEKNEDDGKHYVRGKMWDQNNKRAAVFQEEFIEL